MSKNLLNTVCGLVCIILLIIAVLLSPSCTTKKGFIKYGNKHPDIAAEFCAEEYPAKDSIIQGRIDTLVQVKTRTDTVTTTIVNEVTGETRTIRVPCPPCQQTTRTLVKTDTIIRIDKAKEAVLINRLNEKNTQLIKVEIERDGLKKDNNGLKWFSGISLAAAIFLLFLVLKK